MPAIKKKSTKAVVGKKAVPRKKSAKTVAKKKARDGAKAAGKKYPCDVPNCKVECRSKQALMAHVKHKHPGYLPDPKVVVKSRTLNDLLMLASKGLVPADATQLTQLSDRLANQEVEVHLALSLLVIEKAERLLRLQPLLTSLDNALLDKMDEKFLKELLPPSILDFQKSIVGILNGEAEFIGRILALKTTTHSDLFDQLISVLRRSASISQKGAVELEETVVKLDLLPADREAIRRRITAILPGPSNTGT